MHDSKLPLYVSPDRLKLRAMMGDAEAARLRREMMQRLEYRDEIIARAEARIAEGTVSPGHLPWLRKELARLRRTARPPYRINPNPADLNRRGRFVEDSDQPGTYRWIPDPNGKLAENAPAASGETALPE